MHFVLVCYIINLIQNLLALAKIILQFLIKFLIFMCFMEIVWLLFSRQMTYSSYNWLPLITYNIIHLPTRNATKLPWNLHPVDFTLNLPRKSMANQSNAIRPRDSNKTIILQLSEWKIYIQKRVYRLLLNMQTW